MIPGLNFFKQIEFERATPSCSYTDMSESFLRQLDIARFLADVPFIINSAYRSYVYELERGRSGESAHVKGMAVDIHCIDSASRMKIVDGALAAGINRIGIGSTWVHLDVDLSKKNNVIWLYG